MVITVILKVLFVIRLPYLLLMSYLFFLLLPYQIYFQIGNRVDEIERITGLEGSKIDRKIDGRGVDVIRVGALKKGAGV